MTDNLPAVPEQPRREVAVPDTDSWIDVMRPVLALAERIYDTEFVPKGLRGSMPATAAAMLYGREVGLPPMTALTQTHVIEGKPAMSAEAMRALVLAAGHDLEVIDTTGAICTMRARRRGGERWTELTWTIDMARAAGVAGKNVWKAYPRQMLQARCTTELVRLVFPDVIHGFRAIEELDDGGAEETDALPAPQGRTKVQRSAARKAISAPPAQPAPLDDAARPQRPAGPPLPGEDGYEPAQRATDQASAPSGDDDPPSQDRSVGNDSEDGTDAANTTPQTTDTDPVPVGPVAAGSDEPPGDGEGEAPDPGGSEDQPPRAPRAASRAQHRMIFGQLTELDVTDDERHLVAGRILGHDLASFNELTTDDAKAVIDTLARVKSRAELGLLLAAQRTDGAES